MKPIYIFITILSFIISPIACILPRAGAQGSWQWGRTSSTSAFVDSWAAAADASGNSFVGGYIETSIGSPLKLGSFSMPTITGGGRQAFWAKYDPSGTVLWADGAGKKFSYLFNIATDPSGNLIVFGSFYSPSITIGSFTLTNKYTDGSAQYFLAKIDPSGTVIWAIADGNAMKEWFQLGSTFIMSTGSVATDPAGNIYITSSFTKPSMSIGTTVLTNSASGFNEVFVAKYTPGGTPVWASSFGGKNDDYGFGITCASSGDVYVSGQFASASITAGSSTITNTIGSSLAYIARFSGSSGIPLWAEKGAGNQSSVAVGLASDNAGNVYMAGAYHDTTITFGATTITRDYPKSVPFAAGFLVQYSPANTVTWNKTMGSDANDVYAFCIALASCGQVWVSGSYSYSRADSVIIAPGDTLAPVTGLDPVFIAGYDLTGGVVDYKGLSGGGDDQNGIACDPKGNIFMCSDYYSTITVNTDILAAGGGESFVLAKYSPPPADTATYVHDTTACGGVLSVTLKARPGYTYLWDDGSTGATRLVSGAGKYYVKCTNCAGSLISDTFNLKITTIVVPVYKATDTVLCSPISSFTLKAPGGMDNYLWSTGSTAGSISPSLPGTYYFTSSSSCAYEADTFHVRIITSDTTTKQNYDSVCKAANTYTLTETTGYDKYVWSTGATATKSITANVSTPGTTKYFVYCTHVCSTFIDTFILTSNDGPTVSLGPDAPLCAGDTMTLRSTQPPGSNFLWNTGGTVDNIRVTKAGAYSLTVTNIYGCTGADTINISITPLPVVDLGPDYFSCKGLAYIMNSTGVYTSPTYLWSDATTKVTDTAKVSGTYWLQVTDKGCKGVDTMKATLIFDTLNFYNHDTAICKGRLVPVFATGNNLQTYQWRPTAGIASSTTIDPVIVPDTSATYILTTSLPPCPDRIDSFHIDVQPNPAVFIGDNRVVCQFDSSHVIADVLPRWYKHYIYNWSPATNLDNNNTSAVTFTPGLYTLLKLTVSTPAGCSSKDSVEMIVRPGNFASLNAIYNICPHDSVQFKPEGGVGYEWHPGLYLSDSFSAEPWAKAITTQRYTMIATSIYGCRDTLTAYVKVYPGGIVIMPESVTLYPGETYHISPQTNCSQFSWFPAQGLDNTSIANPMASPQVNTRYVVHAATEAGCPVVDSIDILVSPETLLDLPNAFTPGNGANNTFKILKRGIATLKSFSVYNRWGNKVFHTSNIDEGWDGTYNGVPQPFDVYVYQVEAVSNAGKDFQKHGNVTLIR